jgi:hypothetical protein
MRYFRLVCLVFGHRPPKLIPQETPQIRLSYYGCPRCRKPV